MESRAHRKSLQSKTAFRHEKDVSSGPSSTKCAECKRNFPSSHSLEQHKASLRHKPLSRLPCPIGLKCRTGFPSPSAVLHHLESGRCSSGMNRDDLNQIAGSCDLNITDASSLGSVASTIYDLQAYHQPVGNDMWAIQSDTESEWSMLTPSTSCVSVEDIQEQWSMLDSPPSSTTLQTLRCPMCPKERAGFSTKISLQQHLNSPKHSPKLYKHPSVGQEGDVERYTRCFSTLSGLCQHLESDSGQGGKRILFRYISLIQAQLKQLGLTEIQLLLDYIQM